MFSSSKHAPLASHLTKMPPIDCNECISRRSRSCTASSTKCWVPTISYTRPSLTLSARFHITSAAFVVTLVLSDAIAIQPLLSRMLRFFPTARWGKIVIIHQIPNMVTTNNAKAIVYHIHCLAMSIEINQHWQWQGEGWWDLCLSSQGRVYHQRPTQ